MEKFIIETRMKVIISSFIGSCFVFFAPIWATIILIGVVVFADTMVGIARSIKLKQPIVSRKLYRFASKSVVYCGFVMIFFGFDKLLLNEFVKHFFSIDYALTKLMSIFIMAIEFYSIDESIRLMNNDKGFKYYATKFLKDVKKGKEEINELKENK